MREVPPSGFAFVMATGIISIAAFQLGWVWLSRVLLVLAAAGFGVLAIAFVARCGWNREEVLADARSADRVFDFFAIVAGAAVLAERLDVAGHLFAAVGLAAFAALSYALLTCAVPLVVVFGERRQATRRAASGSWLLWVVGTQSVAASAALFVPAWRAGGEFLATVAVALWAIGVLLYVFVVALIFMRWRSAPLAAAAIGPTSWILMGGCAISVLAGARILALPPGLAARAAAGGVIDGVSVGLWALATSWVPLLVAIGIWRHLARRVPLSYESGLWSIVFPIGMYSAASARFGAVADLGFLRPLANVVLWAAVGAWLLVVGAAARAAVREWSSEARTLLRPALDGTGIEPPV